MIPSSPDPLRKFLLRHCTDERLARCAMAGYARGAESIALEFRRNLETGQYCYDGKGNSYECALMQRHDATPDRPLNELFGAWWIGAFCSEPAHFVLIQNLGFHGVSALLWMVLRGCSELGELCARAAHASIPFVRFVRERDPFPDAVVYDSTVAALEALARSGSDGVRTGRFKACLKVLGAEDEN